MTLELRPLSDAIGAEVLGVDLGAPLGDGAIADIGAHVAGDPGGGQAHVIDCGGKLTIPGLVDMRVFTGEPGINDRASKLIFG